MQIKCTYCGAFISDTEPTCPFCGATNEHLKRTGNGVPTTIEELKAWAIAHKYPLDDMRFFIGEDYKGARAFGIYKDPDSDNFIVYKNKSDGTRVVRYEGEDEAYAVNELYQKMLEESRHQAERAINSTASRTRNTHKKGVNKSTLFTTLFIFILVAGIELTGFMVERYKHRQELRSYYNIEYNANGDAGYYDSDGNWEDAPDYYDSDWDTFWDSDDDSSWSSSDSNSSWDSDSGDSWDDDDWDSDWSGDWDSGDTDWDSDW